MLFHLTDTLRWVLKATVFFALVSAILAVSQTSLATENELIPTAIAIDLLLTVPLVYFLLIRNTSIPKITVAVVFFICFFLGSTVLPNGLGMVGTVAAIVIPAIEIVLLGYLGLRVYRTRKAYALGKTSGLDLIENLRKVLERELKPPALARAVAFEVGIIAYLLFIWRATEGRVFTYHQRNSSRLLLVIFLFLLIVETIGLHILIGLWSPTLAWAATAVSLYLGIQLTAHFKAIALRPIVVSDTSIRIRCGVLGDVSFPRNTIKRVSIIDSDRSDGLDLLPLGGMSQPNVQIELSEPAMVYGVYGTRKEATVIRISVDDPTGFTMAIES